MALVLFAFTLFVSAFVLFLVQPIIGKTILPKLGGTPQVWNTCMVFFQTVLLLGYFYTHAISNRLSQRRQLMLHCVLLFIPFVFLFPHPFDITQWIPPPGANPLVSTLRILFFVVGIPFLVVSTSAPLLQKWFGSTGHPAAKDPYFLYGASNLGSMLALILYPIAIEPFTDLNPQKWIWTVGYGILVLLVLACAALIWKPSGEMRLKLAGAGAPVEPPSEGQPVPPPIQDSGPPSTGFTGKAPSPAPVATAAKSTAIKKGKPHPRHQGPRYETETVPIKLPSDEITTWRRLRWIGLAAVPSSLMLGVTTHITTDLSPIPLFWLIPLTIYLASFILVFSKWPVVWVEEPHTYMLYIQPALIAIMVFTEIMGGMWGPIAASVLAFGATALVCHGEMAKDRPSTRYLTEFYLCMSLGGMLGGMFNGIVAPVVFWFGVAEYGIAVVLACLLRPRLKESGWADEMLAGLVEQPSAPSPAQKGVKGPIQRPAVRSGAGAGLSTALDFILPAGVLALAIGIYFIASPKAGESQATTGLKYFLIYGLPLVIAVLYYGRPLRFGLAIGGIMLCHAIISSRGEASLYSDRSYFGILHVNLAPDHTYTQLTHGHINHGMNMFHPENKADWGNPLKDYSRLATTYYHRLGPAGIVMEKFNWFKGPENTYWGDARMPVSLIGQAALPLATGNLPVGQLVDLWSEPPFATIGLGTGTMASYGRPYQHVHYYEIDNHVRRLSLPLARREHYFTFENLPPEPPFTFGSYRGGEKPKTYFNSLKQAIHRGCEVEVLMGDARLRMNLDYANFHARDDKGDLMDLGPRPPGGPENFYHMMVVDAFSSDAIPVHLITKEALEMYFKHLTPDGILCIHTSNRYVELPKVVAAVAQELGYLYQRGHDQAPGQELGHFTSEWVMVAKRRTEYQRVNGKDVEVTIDPLASLFVPVDYQSKLEAAKAREPNKYDLNDSYWGSVIPERRYLWTDDHSNLWNVMRRLSIF